MSRQDRRVEGGVLRGRKEGGERCCVSDEHISQWRECSVYVQLRGGRGREAAVSVRHQQRHIDAVAAVVDRVVMIGTLQRERGVGGRRIGADAPLALLDLNVAVRADAEQCRALDEVRRRRSEHEQRQQQPGYRGGVSLYVTQTERHEARS